MPATAPELQAPHPRDAQSNERHDEHADAPDHHEAHRHVPAVGDRTRQNRRQRLHARVKEGGAHDPPLEPPGRNLQERAVVRRPEYRLRGSGHDDDGEGEHGHRQAAQQHDHSSVAQTCYQEHSPFVGHVAHRRQGESARKGSDGRDRLQESEGGRPHAQLLGHEHRQQDYVAEREGQGFRALAGCMSDLRIVTISIVLTCPSLLVIM